MLQYGLGGTVPLLGDMLDPPIKEMTKEQEPDFIFIGKENKGDYREDIKFEERFKNACSGVDLFKRQQGLINVLRYLKDDAFRLRRIGFVASKLVAEPENTKSAVVPALLKAVQSAQDFVTLSPSLEPLWEKCMVSNLSNSLTLHCVSSIVQVTMQKVVSGALVPESQGTLLARSIVTMAKESWVRHTLLHHAKELLARPAVLSFLIEAAEEATGPPETSPNYSANILDLTLQIAS